MGVVASVEVVLIVALVALLVPVAWLYARRRWLSRDGGTFDCALRPLEERHPWQLGAARYRGEYLEWFRVFSLGVRPRFRMRRSTIHVVNARHCEPEDGLWGGERVLDVGFGAERRHRRVELAMDPDSATGFLSWIEAAPPSIDRFPDL